MKPAHRMARFIRRNIFLQTGIVMMFWVAGEALVRLLHLPFSGGVAGFILLLTLLLTRTLSSWSLRRASQWFIAEMILFLIPAVLAVLDHRELIGWLGMKILFVLFASTLMVMLVTAFTVEICCRWRKSE
jgi:holin-like protein